VNDYDAAQEIERLKRQLAECEGAREAAESANGRFHLFENAVEDYAFITFDPENRVTGWNRGAERILGYDEASILGKPGSIFFTPEDRARGEDRRELILARAEGRAEDERWHVRQDGRRFWASGVLTPLTDEAAHLVGYCKVLRDLTVRREAEQKLRESEERFRLFVENVSDYALIQVDQQSNVALWNVGAERIFRYTQNQILGQPVSVLFTPEDNALREPERDLGHALTDGRAEYERYLVRKGGIRFWARWVTTPMRDSEGHLRGFAKVVHDETERKLAQEERDRLANLERDLLERQVRSKAQELDRTKEELRALAASLLTAQEDERRRIARELHDDFQQRLALVEMNIARLRQTLPADQRHPRAELNRVEGALSTMSNDLRRLSHQLHPAILEDLGLGAALTRLVEDFQLNREQPVRFEARNIPKQIPAVVGIGLYRVVQEALRNIAKHARDASVTITMTGNSDLLRLSIQDNGPGFTPSDVRFRGGLGLISMYERASLIGADLRVASEPGNGTKVELEVPLAPESGFVPKEDPQ
jgi:PAS domain S-box-containing protein